MSINPWTTISPEDYEGHIQSPEVNQYQFLSGCLKEAITLNQPSDVAIIGCGTGNGLEHIDDTCTKRTTVVDINSNFLDVLKKRHQHRIKGLEIIHDDLHHCILKESQYALVFAGLVFEFVEPIMLLEKISKSMRHHAIFNVVLQLPNSALPEVSKTRFESLKILRSIVKLVDVNQFRDECVRFCLNEIASYTQKLKSGKSFYVGSYRKL